MKVLGVIPARYGSTRFPGKPLALLAGKPLIEHVYQRAKKARNLDELIVATDDQRIFAAVKEFGGKVMMTSRKHQSGTDRVAEVASYYNPQIVVNIQGDEPLINPIVIEKAVEPLLKNKEVIMSTLVRKFAQEKELVNPDLVKVVLDKDNYALYFSRSIIPYQREKTNRIKFYQHFGLYVYRKKFLEKITRIKPSPLEKTEQLEQLRVLENGFKIKVVITSYFSLPVDRPEDLERVAQWLK